VHGVTLFGPTKPGNAWQRSAGGFEADAFRVDWARQRVVCPAGQESLPWTAYSGVGHGGYRRRSSGPGGPTHVSRDPYLKVRFAKQTCAACTLRSRCVRGTEGRRQLLLHPQPAHEAITAARQRFATEEGRRLYAIRAGVEATVSQAVRAFGLRHARYRGLAKTHLQGLVTAVAVNLARVDAWLAGRPIAPTRVSRFARLAA
jgi:hypothetical protein